MATDEPATAQQRLQQADPTPINFAAAADAEAPAWTRADPRAALIERDSTFGWRVHSDDDDEVQFVALAIEDDTYKGVCSCATYAAGLLCEHLCVLRKAEFLRLPDLYDQPVQIATVPEEGDLL